MKPDTVYIVGIPYKIIYIDNPLDVDVNKRELLFGQIDYWTNMIRIYDNGCPEEERWSRILHEIIHGLITRLNLNNFAGNDVHDDLDVLALGITDILFRNNWIVTEEKG